MGRDSLFQLGTGVKCSRITCSGVNGPGGHLIYFAESLISFV